MGLRNQKTDTQLIIELEGDGTELSIQAIKLQSAEYITMKTSHIHAHIYVTYTYIYAMENIDAYEK